MLSKSSLFLIYLYQQFASPYKGYRCAHSVLHGGTGCSGFAKHAIRDVGILRAIPQMRGRFAACRDANRTLQTCKTKKLKYDPACMRFTDCYIAPCPNGCSGCDSLSACECFGGCG